MFVVKAVALKNLIPKPAFVFSLCWDKCPCDGLIFSNFHLLLMAETIYGYYIKTGLIIELSCVSIMKCHLAVPELIRFSRKREPVISI